ncbi:FAD-dependent oxidoreductase [Chloroflexota bacterium]
MHYEELIQEQAPRWPYPVNYGKENEVSCDVLVLGGGIAGCWAAIGAAKKGAKVVLVDKGAVKTSGAGGSGVDHWRNAATNPACTITPEEYTQAAIDMRGGWRNGITEYITSRDGYDCLLELEKMGVKIRDSEDEFKGAEFRDEQTKLLFCTDYAAKYCVRVWGNNAKPLLYKECKRLGVNIFDRIMITSLLNKKGKQGAGIVGATGVNVRTGEFYIFKGKASVLAMFFPQRQYVFSTELKGLYSTHRPCTDSGDGHAMAWKAGAEFAGVEESRRGGRGPYGYPQEGVGHGSPSGTWGACTMVDANGKEIPYVDRDGRILKTVSERYNPAPGQKFFVGGSRYDIKGPDLIPDWEERVKKGEFALPIYADLTSMPEHERKVIFGFMVAQEARTQYGTYWAYTQAGFDPEKDMLQYYDGSWQGLSMPTWRMLASGGLVVDWDLKTSLDGLFAAGAQVFATGDHAYAAASGRWAGRHAAQYVMGADEPTIERKQVEAEKARVYAPLLRQDGMDWKELNAGVCRVMQDYCGELKSEEILKIGLKWFDELEAGEAATAFARNPHELGRLLEVFSIITNGKMIMEACRARKATIPDLGFTRTDYPKIDPPEWRKWVTVKLDEGKVKAGELPLDYHGDLKKNYETHCGL